jgi:hypothetical protein
MIELDHITVAAHSLAQGLSHLRDVLGIDLPPGGAHPRMGTHNHLLRLGPSLFLEVIAIDPAAPAPPRPRWFQLDDPALQAELAIAPRLITWVVRTRQIAEALLASETPLGAIEPMSRGDLRWLITFPNDGKLPDGGMVPTVIQWPDGPHPASRMPDLGCSLERLEAVHPDPATYRRRLASIGAAGLIAVTAAPPGTPPRLAAHIRTPRGVQVIG